MRIDNINNQCGGVALIIDHENIKKSVEIRHYNQKALIWKAKTYGEIIVARAYLPLDYVIKRKYAGNKTKIIREVRVSKIFYKDGNRERDISHFYDKLPHKVKREIGEFIKNEITPIHTSVISKNGKRASSADFEIYCDVMDLLNMQDIGTFVLVTSDKDFTPLIKRIKEKKKRVVIIGVKNGSASEDFVYECDQYGDYHNYMEVHESYLSQIEKKIN